MLCSICAKLATIPKEKKCPRCNSSIDKNLFVVCDTCSNEEKVCSICLKKIIENKGKLARGCQTCGKFKS